MANGTIHIMASGSIDPPTAPISTADNVTYVFTRDFNDSIVIERDNILVDGAGFTVQGNGTGKGIGLTQRTNVTIKNATIKDFTYGIWLNQSANNRILKNDIASNTTQMNNYGIRLEFSTNNVISGNNMTGNRFSLALTFHSSNNTIAGNSVRSSIYGIALEDSQNNIFVGNRIAHNMLGAFLFSSADNNQVCGNNVIVDNSQSGIQIVSSTGNLVCKNNLTANSEDGVFLDSSTGNSIVENYIRGNKYGVRV
jgi:parallel beta-helix repeat protein